MNKFDFDDLNLVPKKCIVDSRSECDTSVTLGGHTFKMPIVPANMMSIIDRKLAIKLAENDYFYIMHRFNFNNEYFVLEMRDAGLIASISIGIKQEDFDFIENMAKLGAIPDYITIDIAHGHSEKVIEMVKHIRQHMGWDITRGPMGDFIPDEDVYPYPFIIAGNVCTPDAVIELQEAGTDAIKVGVGPGHVCTTYMMTGFGSRKCQASTIKDCAKVATVPIIADGGITNPGDVAKALVMGATMVMSGNLLAGCSDSPGELVTMDDKQYKVFYGSASAHQPGKTNRIEGTKKLVPYNDRKILEQLEFLKECLQSSISYAGGRELSIFNTTEWK